MGVMQVRKTGEDGHVLPQNDPFIPLNGDVCYINKLPPELLSRIFEVGAEDADGEHEDDNYVDGIRYYSVDTRNGDNKDVYDRDAKMTEERKGEDEEEGDDKGESDTTGSSDFFPMWLPFQLVASHVCRHWRHVALSTPSLWTTVEVNPEDRQPYGHVSMLLERSKGLPIDISIDCEIADDEDDDDDEGHISIPPSDADVEQLYSLLIPHIHRWRTIRLDVSEYSHMYLFLEAASHHSISSAPQLTSLELYHHEDDSEEFGYFAYPSMSNHFVLFGGSAPCLTHVVLWGVHVDWNQPWIASASKLTELELAYHPEDIRPSWVQFSTILRNASSLRQLNLCQSGPPGLPSSWFIEPIPQGPVDLNGPIQLLKVTDLTLAFHTPLRAIGFLRKFYLPSLNRLDLDFDDASGEDYTGFVEVLADPAISISAQEQPRSLLNSVERLKIAGLPCRMDCALTLYLQLYNLTALNLSMTYLSQIFLDVLCTPLTLPGRGEHFLPRLTTLFVSGASGDNLRELVEKRREMGIPLQTLFVEGSSPVVDEDADWLSKNVKTFGFFEGSDDEDVVDFGDLEEEEEDADEWSDVD